MRIIGFEGDSTKGALYGVESDGGPKTKFDPNAKPVTADFLVEEDGDVHITLRSAEFPRGLTIELNKSGGEYPVFARKLRSAIRDIVTELRAEGH